MKMLFLMVISIVLMACESSPQSIVVKHATVKTGLHSVPSSVIHVSTNVLNDITAGQISVVQLVIKSVADEQLSVSLSVVGDAELVSDQQFLVTTDSQGNASADVRIQVGNGSKFYLKGVVLLGDESTGTPHSFGYRFDIP